MNRLPLRRIIDIVVSVAAAIALVKLGAADQIWTRLTLVARQQMLQRYMTIPAFLSIYFVCWTIVCAPFRYMCGRFSMRQWLSGSLALGLQFVVGGSLLLMCQILSPARWQIGFGGFLLILILATPFALRESPGRSIPRQMLLSVIAWAWLMAGVYISMREITTTIPSGSPPWVANLSMWMTAWEAILLVSVQFVAKESAQRISECAAWSGGLHLWLNRKAFVGVADSRGEALSSWERA